MTGMTDRQKWLAERKQGLGGSDIGAIFNLDFGCARALAYDKRDTPEDFPKIETPEMERGTLLEPVIRTLYIRRSGRMAVEPDPKIVWSPYTKHMFVSMDAITEDREKAGPGYAEFKCVNRFVMKQFKKEGLRRSYILQMQHGLRVAEMAWGSFGILCLDPWEFQYFDVDQDEALQDTIVEQGSMFWHTIHNIGIPDQLGEIDNRCASCPWRRTCRGQDFSLAPTSEDKRELVHSPELLPLVAEWVDLDQIVKAAEAAIEPIKEQLKIFIADRYGFTVPGARVIMPRWDETRWETKLLNQLLPRIQAVAGKDIWDFIDTVDIEAFPLVQEYVLLLSMIAKARKASPKSSIRYYASADE